MTEIPKTPTPEKQDQSAKAAVPQPSGEQGGQEGPEPTRYGDWEKAGRCTDF